MDPIEFPLPSVKNKKLGGTVFIFVNFSPYVINSTGEARFEIRFGGETKPSIIHKVRIELAKKSEV